MRYLTENTSPLSKTNNIFNSIQKMKSTSIILNNLDNQTDINKGIMFMEDNAGYNSTDIKKPN